MQLQYNTLINNFKGIKNLYLSLCALIHKLNTYIYTKVNFLYKYMITMFV